MATAAGVLGIVGLAMAVIPALYWFLYELTAIDAQTYDGVSGVNALLGLDFVVATLALVFGAISLARESPKGSGRALARIGLALGAVALVMAIVFLPLAITASNTACSAIVGGC